MYIEGRTEMTVLEFLKANRSAIENITDKLDDHLNVLDELDSENRFTQEEEKIFAEYRKAWEVVFELSRDIDLYIKNHNANHS